MDILDPDLVERADEYICAICSHISMKPLAIDCSHLFCGKCLRQWVTTKPTCPSCNSSINIEKAVPNNFVWKMIEKLQFKCPNVKSGCDFADIGGVDLRNLKTHLDQCPFQLLECSLCKDKVVRHDMENHKLYQCLEGDVTCRKCDEQMRRRELSAHQQNALGCENWTICRHGCNKELLQRDIPKHDEECAEKIIRCETCAVPLRRKEFATHDTESMLQHFRAMQKQIRDLQQTTQTLERLLLGCGQGDGVYQSSTETTEEFTWFCKDYVKSDKLNSKSPKITMKAGYKFVINAEIKEQHIKVFIFLKPNDNVEWPFPYPFTIQTLRPSIHSHEIKASSLVKPENINSFGPSPTRGFGSKLLPIAELGDHPLLIKFLFHLDQKIAGKAGGDAGRNS